MFSFNSLHPGSPCPFRAYRRHLRHSVFTLLVMLCSTVLLLTGCKSDPDDPDYELNSNLIGTWRDYYDLIDPAGYDGYKITATRVEYDFGGFVGYGGTIQHVSNFTKDSGVIIFKYDTDAFDDGALIGKYNGIYYKELLSGVSVALTTATDSDYSSPATETLNAAKETFTAGNSGDYTRYWLTYSRHP